MRKLLTIIIIAMMSLTSIIITMQILYPVFIAAKGQISSSSTDDRANNLLPMPDISSSSSFHGRSRITPNISDNSKMSPTAATRGNKIPDGSITTSKLADDAVTNSKLAPDAVTSDKIKDGEVDTADIADGAVTTPKITDQAVTTDKILDDAITTYKLANGSVTTRNMEDQSVTANKIVGLNKLLFTTCTTSYQLLQRNEVFCSFPGVQDGDSIIITAQEFLDNFNAHFDCGIVSSAKASQSDNVRIGIADACGNPPPNSITIKATFV